ncbi:DUF2232 domain-containing protein [Hazenella sp. IB182357]|uniref:DUF2232 domain-containing protein n=1 Tax=Polycladospora coralii TaxID=2771432 RepID=A0A926NAF0_9BACL|nr:DUF2232 domain-containing protein [Polycladospora coralii]MBD1371995.1 DUF2232 domain-containing protein [Polycladospora coralii]MBS7530501.1 DUF2232 domain-containing protein [Polycladospora coralii]
MSQNESKERLESLKYTGLFLLFIILMPLLPILSLITPLPILLLTIKHPRSALIYPAILLLIVTLTSENPYTVGIFLAPVLIGITMGICYRVKHTTGTDIALVGVVSGVISSWIIIWIAQSLFGFLDLLDQKLNQTWSTMGIYEQLEPPQLVDYLPVMIFLFVICMVLINIWIMNKRLIRAEFPGKYITPFSKWKLPRIFLYFFVILMLVSLWNGENSWLMGILNVLYLLFMIQGAAFTSFWLKSRDWSQKWMIGLVLFHIVFPLPFLILGMVDIGTSIRKKI